LRTSLMRLRVSRTSADERLTHLLAAGYRILLGMQNAKRDRLFVRTEDDALVSTWGSEVLQALLDIFPTDLENNAFNNADFRRTYFSGPDQPFQEATERLKGTSIRARQDSRAGCWSLHGPTPGGMLVRRGHR
jgi:hypothetical protein